MMGQEQVALCPSLSFFILSHKLPCQQLGCTRSAPKPRPGPREREQGFGGLLSASGGDTRDGGGGRGPRPREGRGRPGRPPLPWIEPLPGGPRGGPPPGGPAARSGTRCCQPGRAAPRRRGVGAALGTGGNNSGFLEKKGREGGGGLGTHSGPRGPPVPVPSRTLPSQVPDPPLASPSRLRCAGVLHSVPP